MNIIPTTIVNAFATGDILQVLFFSVLFGLAVLHMGKVGKQLVSLIDQLTHGLFGMVGPDHVCLVDRRLRRDGVHDRPVRHRHAACRSAS